MNGRLQQDCRNEELVEEIFGSVSEFARLVEANGDDFKYGMWRVTYAPRKDIHYFNLEI
jgi:hypothetical protein